MIDCGFVTLGNAEFFEGVRTLVLSIRTNSPAPVCVIDQGFTAQQVSWLSKLGASVITVQRTIPLDHPRFGCCYALFDIDRAPFEKLIYLDADMLVLEDIRDLFARVGDGRVLCSFSNPAARLVNRRSSSSVSTIFEQLGEPRRASIALNPLRAYRLRRYQRLNSGVVGITRRTMAFLKSGIPRYADILGKLRFPDQDLLSLLAVDYRLRLDPLPYVDNATRLHLHPESAIEKRPWQERNHRLVTVECRNGKLTIIENRYPKGIRLANARVRVLHYNSPDKPWKEGVVLREGFKELWLYYNDRAMLLANADPPPLAAQPTPGAER